MRGKDIKYRNVNSGSGITPAYAGKSFPKALKHLMVQDHPRLCGEKSLGKALQRQSVGSPPPMRGKVRGLYRWCSGHQDHPRLCGEKQYTAAQCTGNHRITPAYAGKSTFDIVPYFIQ